MMDGRDSECVGRISGTVKHEKRGAKYYDLHDPTPWWLKKDTEQREVGMRVKKVFPREMRGRVQPAGA
jgi:hypothetical protein